MTARKPNLFLIGSMKCGTSTLHDHLDAHPDIFMSRPKEPSRFVSPEQLRIHWPRMAELGYCDSLDRYLALFDNVGDVRYAGESSTLYTKLPELTGVAERLHKFAPEARLIYIVRDPIERTLSHYWYRVKRNGEARSPIDAIASKRDPRYRALSDYAMQLRPYLERFGEGQIYVETLENLHTDLGGTLSRIFRWLGVSCEEALSLEPVHSNPTPKHLRRDKARLVGAFRNSPLWDVVRPLMPGGLRRIAKRTFTHQVQRSEVDLGEIHRYLRPLQQEQAEEFFELVGVRYDRQWATLYPEGPT